MKIVPVSIALAAVFTVLTFFWACNPGQPWWRKRELVTDLCYWFIIPLFARYLRIGLLVVGAALLFGITTADGLVEFYDDGHGPLAQLPLWLQAVHLPGRLRSHDVLDPSRLPSAGDVEIPRGASFLRGARLDLGGALPSGQHLPRQRRGRCRAAAGRHFAERAGVPRPVHHRAFGLRARQSRTGRSGRSTTCSPARCSTAGTTPRRNAAARRTSPRPFRCST